MSVSLVSYICGFAAIWNNKTILLFILYLKSIISYLYLLFYESLFYGCPVLTTNSTPWNDLEKFNAGWNMGLNNFSKIKEKIEEIIDTDENEYSLFLSGCTKYVDSFNKTEMLNNNLNLFE